MTANADSLRTIDSVSGGSSDTQEQVPESGARKRPKPGERRVQILQALAAMLEQPGAERVTTAALARSLSSSPSHRKWEWVCRSGFPVELT